MLLHPSHVPFNYTVKIFKPHGEGVLTTRPFAGGLLPLVLRSSGPLDGPSLLWILPSKGSDSLPYEATVALWHFLVLRICCTFYYFDSAVTEILGGAVCGSPPQSVVDLRSQLFLACSAICGLAQCRATFKPALPQIFRAPLSAKEVADIFVASSDCAQSVGSGSLFPTPSTKKQVSKSKGSQYVESDGGAAEDVPHAQESGSTLADAAVWQQHPMEPWRLSPTWEP